LDVEIVGVCLSAGKGRALLRDSFDGEHPG